MTPSRLTTQEARTPEQARDMAVKCAQRADTLARLREYALAKEQLQEAKRLVLLAVEMDRKGFAA